HTSGGSKSIYFSSTSGTGGPADVVLPFGGVITSGVFTFSSWFKVPAAKTAYFNFQGGSTIAATGNIYSLDVFMNADGSMDFQNAGTSKLMTTYPQGAWYELEIVANLSTNNWSVLVDGVLKGSFSSTENKVSFLDIYPANAQAQFWVDDVHYDVAPYTIPSINGAVAVVNVTNGLVGQSQNPTVEVKNAGMNTITSFDLTFNNNGTPATQNITGVSIAAGASYIVNIPAITLVAGSNTYTATISNVNGAGADGDNLDDSKFVSFTPVAPAAGKMVAAEEGTGTWCGWCPRGAVFMDMMDTKYSGYFAPIAVHNADPMTDATYDAAMGALIGGYPSALVDRLPEIDPGALEPSFLNRIVIAPKGFLVNGANYNTTTRVLNVSLTTTMQVNITGNYKIACVLTEDAVTGTASGYAQTNYYAGGGNGVMGGYELLSSPVPAASMVYDHVARAIAPSFAGLSSAFGTSAASGAVFTHNFSFTLPSTWDENEIHIIGLFIDPSGKVDNASSTSITEAVTNGFVTATSGVGVTELGGPDAQFNLYPNPTTGGSALTVVLEKDSEVSLAVYQVNGALIARKDYGQLNGAVTLPIEIGKYDAGMYFVHVTVNGTTSVLKLIRE
ncbi:MAG: Omp28-related outer membrane protein, partial [Bacteroidota bacterium]|nr:Omp28-related outer membrane protein [Bacteroidota bacterium]